MSSLKLGDWETVVPIPPAGTLGTTAIFGRAYGTVVLPGDLRKEWLAENFALASLSGSPIGSWWNFGASDDGYGRYYLRTESDALVVSGVLPNGWRVPTIADVADMIAGAGGTFVAGGNLKTIGTTYWTTPNTGAVDTYGFQLRGHGQWHYIGGWRYRGTEGFLWTGDSIVDGGNTTCIWGCRNTDAEAIIGSTGLTSAWRFPIRLVRDIAPIHLVGTHDILVSSGLAETTDSLAQRVDVRLRTFIGEHWLNPELGVPWFEEFLRKAPDPRLCRQILVAVLQDVPGVVAVESVDVALDKVSRQMRVSFVVSGNDSIPQSGITAVTL